MRYIKRAIFIVLISFCLHLKAQRGGNVFYNLTTANGLSSNRTISVIQDKKGFYWIGTLDGLNRFDGTSCKVFQNIEQDSTSLSHNTCISLLEDDKGDIWIATLMGLNRYRKDGKFDRFFFHNPGENFDRVNWIWGLTKDSSGNIWVSTCGLWQYNIYTKKWREWLHDPGDPGSIPKGTIHNLVYDKKSNCLWMTGNPGFILYDITKEKFYHKKNNPNRLELLNNENYTHPFLLDNDDNIWFFAYEHDTPLKYSIKRNEIENIPVRLWRGVFSMNIDDLKRIWIHFWNGASYIYDPSSHLLDSVFLDNYHSQSPIGNNAKDLFVDRSGNYWISTWQGVSIFNPNAQAIKYYSLSQIPSNAPGPAFAITAVAEQNDSILWVGTSAGLYHYNINTRKLIYKSRSFPNNNYGYIRSLFFQNDSILWIGGWVEVLCYNVKRDKLISVLNKIDLPQSITTDAQGSIWVGTWSNGLYKLSPSGQIIKHFLPGIQPAESILSSNLVCLRKTNRQDDIWVGYNGGDGFSVMNLQQERFRHYKVRNIKKDNFPTYAVNCIQEDNKKNIWLGTFGRGIIRFDPLADSFKTFMQSDGLKGNFINSILADDSSRLWISTTTGINILDIRNNDIIQTDIDLSFPSNDFLANGVIRKNGKLLFFGGTRIIEIDPYTYYRSAKSSEILLSSFKVFDKEKYFSDTSGAVIRLKYRENFFSIDYSLLKANPNSVTQYAYQLKGFDKDWNYVRERRTAYYTNVTPGEYTFLVKATDENGKWTYSSKGFSIVIAPPFWKTWWFYLFSGMVLISVLYLVYNYRINQLKKLLTMRARISQDLHDEVGSTLSSIHVYSSVATKTLDNDPEQAKGALKKINENTRLVMENMSDIVWAINTGQIGETSLEAKLKNYGYELLTPLNIQCSYQIDKETEKKLTNIEARRNILLIVKEALNNIAKYSSATKVMVRLEKADKNIVLEIADNGKGFEKENGHMGQGLNNMKQRAEVLGGKLELSSEKDKGTRVKCIIPVTILSD